MRRFGYFWSGLPLGSKLQFVALGLILGSVFWNRDLNPARRWFGRPLWQVTVPLILLMFVLGRLLLPLMLRSPLRTQRALYRFGMLVFVLGIYASTQRWGRLMITHVSLSLAMWLDVSCWFWFISEIQIRAAELLSRQSKENSADDDSESDDAEEEEFER